MYSRLLTIFATTASLVYASEGPAPSNPADFFGGQNNQAYLDWVATSLGDNYPNALFVPSSVDPSKGIAIHWKISEVEGFIDLGLAVPATGWLGFGLSDNGGMTGSDVLLFEAADPQVVVDAHIEEQRLAKEDDCQDWVLLDSSTDTEFLMIKVRRRLITGDTQDLPIRNDAEIGTPVHRVIAAWGDEEVVGYHGPRTARGSIRFFGEGVDEAILFQHTMQQEATGSFFVGTEDYPIKAQDTEYPRFCVSGNDLRTMEVDLESSATLVGFDPVIDNVEHVHHFIIYASFDEINEVTDCNQLTMTDMVYIWAPGEPPLALPSNVGFALGGEDGYRSFQIEIHYDNPDLKAGEMDSSGVQFYYNTQPREHRAGILIVGDATLALMGQKIKQGLTDYGFSCPGSCSTFILDEPVTVMREFHHMHQSGVSSFNQHIRDGRVLRTGRAQYFDFRQQGGHVIQQEPFEIQPGDSFHTKCFYRNEDGDRKFGLSSSDEMCMTFMLYYPRKSIPGTNFGWMCGIGLSNFGLTACETAWDTAVLDDEGAMERTFGTPSMEQCQALPFDGQVGNGSGGMSGAGNGINGALFFANLVAALSFIGGQLL